MSHSLRALWVFPAIVAAAHASTFVISTGTNTSLGTTQLVGLSPILVIPEIPPNGTLPLAQPVSPQYYAQDVLGSIGPGHSQEFFSVNINSGAHLETQVSTVNPALEAVELLLYDANQNLVAIANGNMGDGVSSIIDFTVPAGDSGLWTAEVSQSPSDPNPSPAFSYDLRFNSPINYLTIVQGKRTNPQETDFYSVASNVGDHLHFFAETTDSLKANEILLYDPNGNLVAIANGNFSNGLWSVIDFTVPNGDAGNWVIEVTGSPSVNDPNTDLFKYDLQIGGATGTGPINPLAPPIATPEPSYAGFLGCLVAGFGLFRRERRKTATE